MFELISDIELCISTIFLVCNGFKNACYYVKTYANINIFFVKFIILLKVKVGGLRPTLKRLCEFQGLKLNFLHFILQSKVGYPNFGFFASSFRVTEED